MQSGADESAHALMDNVTITNVKGTVYENSFNDPYSPLSGMSSSHSHDGCYEGLYKGPTYTVVFTDGNGNVIKVVEAREYTYAYCDEVPQVEGKVLKGWSEDTHRVSKDMIVVPVYGEPEAETPSKPQGNGGGGCSSSVSMLGVGVAIFACAACLFKGKKEA